MYYSTGKQYQIKWTVRKMCEINGIKPLVEHSLPGKGAHVWIFFKKAIPASVVRSFVLVL